MASSRHALSISLTEPVVFLRAGSDGGSRRRRHPVPTSAPSLLRGVLSLKLAKPTRIVSIKVELSGVSTTEWQEGDLAIIGSRKNDLVEENTFLTSSATFFRASNRRARTVGPGASIHEDNEHDSASSLGGIPFPRHSRRQSADHGRFHRPYIPRTPSLDSLSDNDRNQEPAPTYAGLQHDSDALSPPLSPEGRHSPSSTEESHRPPIGFRGDSGTSNQSSTPSNRRSTRLSLSGVFHDMKELVQAHTPRRTPSDASVPTIRVPNRRRPSISASNDENDERGRTNTRKQSRMAKIGEVFGIDMDEKNNESSQEFRSELKAEVHRPGPFSPKFTCCVPVEVIAAPSEDELDEGDIILVERQWDYQLRYLLSFNGRNFPQGGEIGWSIQLMPLTKMKLHRLTILIEEKTEYQAHYKNASRADTAKRFSLLVLRHSESRGSKVNPNGPPLLPILSDSPSAVEDSGLLQYADPLDPGDDQNERLSQCIAHLWNRDGPWHLKGSAKVPEHGINISIKHPSSGVRVKHSLKMFLRVERGDDQALDVKGHRKQYDIIIETPITILSHHCRPDWALLPRYEASLGNIGTSVASHTSRIQIPTWLGGRDSSHHGFITSPIVAPAHPSRPSSPTNSPPISPTLESEARAETSLQFARLVAGYENESGELPPPYSTTPELVSAIPSNGALSAEELPSAATSPPGGSLAHSLSTSPRTAGLFSRFISPRVSERNEAAKEHNPIV